MLVQENEKLKLELQIEQKDKEELKMFNEE